MTVFGRVTEDSWLRQTIRVKCAEVKTGIAKFFSCLTQRRSYTAGDAIWPADIAVELVSLATGGLHEPAVPARRARSRRRGTVHDGPGQRAVTAGKAGEGVQAHRDPARRFTAGRSTVRQRAGGNAGRGAIS